MVAEQIREFETRKDSSGEKNSADEFRALAKNNGNSE